MDTFTFVKDIVNAVCWPLTLIIIIVLQRKPIGKFISKLASFKLKTAGIEINMDSELKSIDKTLGEQSQNTNPQTLSPLFKIDKPDEDEAEEGLASVASASPNVATLVSWQLVDQEIKNALDRAGIADKGGSPYRMISQLKENKLINADVSEALSKMYDIRNTVNTAQRAATMSVSGAEKYSRAASKAVNVLKLV